MYKSKKILNDIRNVFSAFSIFPAVITIYADNAFSYVLGKIAKSLGI